MSRRESIDNGIWDDPDFARLAGWAKLVYLWSFTNPRCGMAGLYKVLAEQKAAAECGISRREAAGALADLEAARFVFVEQDVIWVRTRVRYIGSRTSQIAKSVARDVEKIPIENPLRRRFLDAYANVSWLREALREVNAEQIPTQLTLVEATPKLVEEKSSNDGAFREPHGNLTRGSMVKVKDKVFVKDPSEDVDLDGKRQTSEPEPSRARAREAVFEAWRQATGKTGRTRLDAKRTRLIDAALAAYPLEDVLDAVRGWRNSTFHVENGHHGLNLLLRDSEMIEKFRDLQRSPPVAQPRFDENEQRRQRWLRGEA